MSKFKIGDCLYSKDFGEKSFLVITDISSKYYTIKWLIDNESYPVTIRFVEGNFTKVGKEETVKILFF